MLLYFLSPSATVTKNSLAKIISYFAASSRTSTNASTESYPTYCGSITFLVSRQGMECLRLVVHVLARAISVRMRHYRGLSDRCSTEKPSVAGIYALRCGPYPTLQVGEMSSCAFVSIKFNAALLAHDVAYGWLSRFSVVAG